MKSWPALRLHLAMMPPLLPLLQTLPLSTINVLLPISRNIHRPVLFSSVAGELFPDDKDMARRAIALLLALVIVMSLLMAGGSGARETAVRGFQASKYGRVAARMGKEKEKERELRQVPSGPDPLHHNGSPKKPQTP